MVESRSGNGSNTAIVAIVLLVVLALFFFLFFFSPAGESEADIKIEVPEEVVPDKQ